MPQPRPDRWRPGSVDPTHKTMRRSSQPCDPLPGRVPVRPSDKPLNTQETSKVSDTFTNFGDELSTSDIAELAQVGPSAVSNWRKRYDDFPQPIEKPGKWQRFRVNEVLEWLERHGRIPEPPEPPKTLKEALWNSTVLLRGLMPAASALLLGAALLESFRTNDKRLRNVIDKTLDAAPQEALDILLQKGLHWKLRQEETTDVLLDVLLELFEEIGNATRGEHHTSPELASLVADLFDLDHNRDAVIYDPCCGTGRTLVRLGENHPSPRYYGQEINREYVDVSSLLLALASSAKAGTWTIEHGDSLRYDAFPDMRADFVVAEPPLGVRINEVRGSDPRWVLGDPGREASNAWIQIALSHLNDSGLAAIVVDEDWAKFSPSKHIRAALVRQNLLDAVIALPGGMLAGTSLSGLLLILAKDRSTRDHPRQSGDFLVFAGDLERDHTLMKDLKEGRVPLLAQDYQRWRYTGKKSDSEFVDDDVSRFPYIDSSLEYTITPDDPDPDGPDTGPPEPPRERPDPAPPPCNAGPEEVVPEDEEFTPPRRRRNTPGGPSRRPSPPQPSTPSETYLRPSGTTYEEVAEHGFVLTPRRYVKQEHGPDLADLRDHLKDVITVTRRAEQASQSVAERLDTLEQFYRKDKGSIRSQRVGSQVRFEFLAGFLEDLTLDLVEGIPMSSLPVLPTEHGFRRVITPNSLAALSRGYFEQSRRLEASADIEYMRSKHVTSKSWAEKRLVRRGDVIVSVGGPDPESPIVHRATGQEANTFLARPLFALRVVDPKSSLTPEFLVNWTKTTHFSNQVNRFRSSRGHFHSRSLLKFEVPVNVDASLGHRLHIASLLRARQLLDRELDRLAELDTKIFDIMIHQEKAAELDAFGHDE